MLCSLKKTHLPTVYGHLLNSIWMCHCNNSNSNRVLDLKLATTNASSSSKGLEVRSEAIDCLRRRRWARWWDRRMACTLDLTTMSIFNKKWLHILSMMHVVWIEEVNKVCLSKHRGKAAKIIGRRFMWLVSHMCDQATMADMNSDPLPQCTMLP